MFCLAFLAIVVGGILGVTPVSAAGTNDFYFEDFTADYYLSRDAEGVSKMRVVEKLTAVFPDYRQNKGICRQIPFLNQDGENVTLPSLTRADVTVLRNGAPEPIYSIDKYGDYYEVCTGDEDYVLGEQEYTFEYEFERVVTDFTNFQELYWDTNGNGWRQKFNSVTARVHFSDEVLGDFTGESWCYVGKYGASGQERCQTIQLSDGVVFSAEDLSAGENLTFDVEFLADSFVVPEPEKNYALVILFGVVVGICVIIVAFAVRKYVRGGEKRKFYQEYFVKPEYQPHVKYSLAEMAEVYFGKKKDVKVGILLEMIVSGRIALVRKESQIFKTKKWAIEVRNLKGARVEELVVLAILNGGDEATEGSVIELRERTADTMLVRLGKKFDSTVLADLKRDGLVESKYKIKGSSLDAQAANVMVVWIVMFFCFAMPFLAVGMEVMEEIDAAGLNLVGKEWFLPVTVGVVVLTIVLRSVLSRATKKYAGHTLKGLEMARYMEGLEMYIRMAEAERMKFLQSVEGADVSPTGIVKLYEKLLPYAAVFGLEKSWMGELEKYAKVAEIEPEWYPSGASAMDVIITSRLAAGYAGRASHFVSSGGSSISGGGSSSSSFSGGGGGGFSGGGGGGGGGGGR